MSEAGRLLLIEDDAQLRGALALILRARGWDVEPAGSAADALSTLAEHRPDVVVADLGLPDRSGAELVEDLRHAAPDTRLVVFTGREDPAVRRACRDAGADDYVTKPVSGDDLARMLTG